METIIGQLLDYLANDETNPALRKLNSIFSFSESDLLNEVILLQARFSRLLKEMRKGKISTEDSSIERNRINDSVLELVDEIKHNPEEFSHFSEVDTALDLAAENRNAVLSLKKKDALYERISYMKEKGEQYQLLWIDDSPPNNIHESSIISEIGVQITHTTSSAEAMDLISANQFDVLISDISRESNEKAGLDFHQKLIHDDLFVPTIFYLRYVDRSLGVPPYAFGIADMPNSLAHLVIDVLQRKE